MSRIGRREQFVKERLLGDEPLQSAEQSEIQARFKS